MFKNLDQEMSVELTRYGFEDIDDGVELFEDFFGGVCVG